MSKGFLSRIAGAGRMAYYEFTDPVDDAEIEADEREIEDLHKSLETTLNDYESLLAAYDTLEQDYDTVSWERDDWKRRYEDLLANALAPVQEGEPLLLPADKLKPHGYTLPDAPADFPTKLAAKWLDQREAKPKAAKKPLKDDFYPEDVRAELNAWMQEPAKKTPKKPVKKTAKKPVKKAGK